MNDIELCKWLRANSSGTYKTSASGADRIEALLERIAELELKLSVSCLLEKSSTKRMTDQLAEIDELKAKLLTAERNEATWGRRCVRDAMAKEQADERVKIMERQLEAADDLIVKQRQLINCDNYSTFATRLEQIVTGRITGGSDSDNLYQCRKIAAGIYCDLTGEKFDDSQLI